MSSSDLFTADYPHGTPEGFDGPDGHDGCRGGACPGADMWGLSCKRAKQLSRSDYQYQKLAAQGLTPAAIADELGLVPTGATAAPVTKRAPKPKPADRAAAKKAAKAEVAAAFAVDEELLDNGPDTNLSDQHDAGYTEVMDDSVGLQEQIQTLLPQIEPEIAAYLGRPGELTAISIDVQGTESSVENPTPAAAPTPKEIRTWAIERGYEVKPMGKLPQHIIDHYWETHGLLGRPAHYAPAKVDPDTDQVDTETPAAATIVPEPDGRRPEWAHVTLTEDLARAQTERDALAEELEETKGELTRARGLAARLEEELARDREEHAAEISDLHLQLSGSHHGIQQRIQQLEESIASLEQDERIRAWELVTSHRAFAGCHDEEAPLITSILKRLNELTNQNEASTIARLSSALELTIRKWAAERERGDHLAEVLAAKDWLDQMRREETHRRLAAITDRIPATPDDDGIQRPGLARRIRRGWMTGR
jgi:hypothetical protein